MRGVLRILQLLAQRGECRQVRVVAIDVTQKRKELRERRLVDAASVLFEAVAGTSAKLIEVPALLRHGDHRDVQMAALQHRLQ